MNRESYTMLVLNAVWDRMESTRFDDSTRFAEYRRLALTEDKQQMKSMLKSADVVRRWLALRILADKRRALVLGDFRGELENIADSDGEFRLERRSKLGKPGGPPPPTGGELLMEAPLRALAVDVLKAGGIEAALDHVKMERQGFAWFLRRCLGERDALVRQNDLIYLGVCTFSDSALTDLKKKLNAARGDAALVEIMLQANQLARAATP